MFYNLLPLGLGMLYMIRPDRQRGDYVTICFQTHSCTLNMCTILWLKTSCCPLLHTPGNTHPVSSTSTNSPFICIFHHPEAHNWALLMWGLFMTIFIVEQHGLAMSADLYKAFFFSKFRLFLFVQDIHVQIFLYILNLIYCTVFLPINL